MPFSVKRKERTVRLVDGGNAQFFSYPKEAARFGRKAGRNQDFSIVGEADQTSVESLVGDGERGQGRRTEDGERGQQGLGVLG